MSANSVQISVVEQIDPATAARGPKAYAARLAQVLATQDWTPVHALTRLLADAWRGGHAVFICGNGGSAANATHWANDFVYPVARTGRGLRISALSANTAVLTCLANDLGYEKVFAHQLRVMAKSQDVLIVLSGSGNSPNIIEALHTAREMGMRTVGVLGFSGGAALPLVDLAIHFAIDDMQIAEDLQLVVNHMVMQALSVDGVARD